MTYEERDLADLLQPYVDGELSDDERKQVAHYLEASPEAQARVQQQQAVRAALRSLEREIAPSQLRAAVLQGLDEVDAESSNVVEMKDGAGRSKARAILRGALLMAPAAAAAVALFFVVRGDLDVAAARAEGESPYAISLDGDWKFFHAPSPEPAPTNTKKKKPGKKNKEESGKSVDEVNNKKKPKKENKFQKRFGFRQ